LRLLTFPTRRSSDLSIYDLNISSTKSMIGHLLGAAGAVEGIAAILAIRDGIIPPTINHFTEDPQLDPKINFTFNTAQKRKVNAVDRKITRLNSSHVS